MTYLTLAVFGVISCVIVIGDANVLKDISISTGLGAPVSIFKSIQITGIQTCIYLCKIHAACILVNFNRHGNMCKMWFSDLPIDTITVNKQQSIGKVSWSKASWDQPEDPDVTVCGLTDERQECKTFCVDASAFTSTNGTIIGNMVVGGSKLIYDTPNGPVFETTCQSSGAWSIEYGTPCWFKSFIEDTLTDGTAIKYRVCHDIVDHPTAERQCELHDAALLQITTEVKHEYFVDLLQGPAYRGNYWFDALDVGSSWQTSDGKAIPVSVINHHSYNQKCARLTLDTNYRAKNIQCYRSFNYICEVRD